MLRKAILPMSILLWLSATGPCVASPASPVPAPEPRPSTNLPDAVVLSRQVQVEAALALPEGLRAELSTLELNQGVASLDKVRRLYEFMVGEEGLGLRYKEQPTYGIAESYAHREVNCLSFTMMFIALARAAGMNAYAQASDDALAIRVLDDALYRARHVKAGVDIGGLQYTVDVGWRSVVAESRPRRISDTELVALLHSNNAVERLLQGDKETATTEVGRMLALDTSNPTIWNNAGVVHWRSGRAEAAEQAYLKALSLEKEHLGALANLVVLHRALGDDRQAEAYGARLKRAQASDPFSQFLLAREFTENGAYDQALAHYRRAIRLLPNEPTFHRGMGETYQRMGKAAAAQRAFDRADSLELRKYSQRGIRDADASS